MDQGTLILIVLIATIGIGLLILLRRRPRRYQSVPLNTPFSVRFANGNRARAVYITHGSKPETIRNALGFKKHTPALFIVGGASGMTAEDARRTQAMLDVVAKFAEEHGITVIDGGTESGVMQMTGESRLQGRYTFPLIGIAPASRIRFPGYDNLAAEADLEDSHSHFVLVEGSDWGSESNLIQDLAQTTSGTGTFPVLGMLINGGNIALNELVMATKRAIPMFVIEGSGRAADQVASAFKTGQTSVDSLKTAIASGADIQFINTSESPDRVYQKLSKRFGKAAKK
jgi:hypothetical protein